MDFSIKPGVDDVFEPVSEYQCRCIAACAEIYDNICQGEMISP
jgi:hypothetical protein